MSIIQVGFLPYTCREINLANSWKVVVNGRGSKAGKKKCSKVNYQVSGHVYPQKKKVSGHVDAVAIRISS